MSKRRQGFNRRARDNYPTPWAAVPPLLPHLKPETRFIEPCAGEGLLVGHLRRNGHICTGAFDLPTDARIARYDIKSADVFITNPPWQTRPSNILHPIIVNLSDQAPTWILIYSDWLFTSQAKPLLPRLESIVVIGRQKWIVDLKSAGFDNCCWCLFARPRNDLIIHLFGRMGARAVAARNAAAPPSHSARSAETPRSLGHTRERAS